jgi:hypothetical protein
MKVSGIVNDYLIITPGRFFNTDKSELIQLFILKTWQPDINDRLC